MNGFTERNHQRQRSTTSMSFRPGPTSGRTAQLPPRGGLVEQENHCIQVLFSRCTGVLDLTPPRRSGSGHRGYRWRLLDRPATVNA